MTFCKPHEDAPRFSPHSPSSFGYLVRQGVQSGTPLPLQQSPPAVKDTYGKQINIEEVKKKKVQNNKEIYHLIMNIETTEQSFSSNDI